MQRATRAQWFLLWLFIFGLTLSALNIKILWEWYSNQGTVRTSELPALLLWTLFILACTAAGAYGLWFTHRQALLANQTHRRCHNCKYDLAGLALSAPCPECGWVKPDDPESSPSPALSIRLRQQAMNATNESSRIASAQAASLVWSLEHGQLEHIRCPECEHDSIRVWFTHPGTEYKIWFLCQACPFRLRIQASGRPRLFSQARVDRSLQEFDEHLASTAKFPPPPP